MPKLTAEELVNAIALLDVNRYYDYVTERSKVKYVEIVPSAGPIKFVRYDNQLGTEGPTYNISVSKIAELAKAFSERPNYPIHLDTLFGSAGNDRSALETLLLHTPHFFWCRRHKKKHIMWCPDKEHPLGSKVEEKCPDIEEESPEADATHTQIQANLVEIGRVFNCLCWVAKGDRTKSLGKIRLGDFEGVLPSLNQAQVFSDIKSRDFASEIDCIWFTKDWRRIPAIFEIEHTTSIRSGLDRMIDLHHTMPSFKTQ